MGRNLILCSDGTGNLGGTTPESNVFKLYQAIDIHNHEKVEAGKPGKKQLTFYDNGVGTASNKYWRAISGAFGFGFGKNVRDMYHFLAKHYRDGDDIYLFGFSRGAATVRAFSGFVADRGLIDGKDMEDLELEAAVKEAFNCYSRNKPNPEKFKYRKTVPIKFIGVWDTVSALGFPQKTDVTGIGIWAINRLLRGLDRCSDFIFPHNFYSYELTDNVENAFQALAIDDERTSFLPKVWDEKHLKKCNVEQVWFAGMHSNVGGGYPRSGMANVAFFWMLNQLEKHGDLSFKQDIKIQAQEDQNPFGRMYDSRSGAGVFFRYHPRELEKLCEGKLNGMVKIHDSVLERMQARTANYAPTHLPGKFEAVASEPDESGRVYEPEEDNGWLAVRGSIGRVTWLRKWLYGIFLEFWLAIIAFAGWLWICNPVDKATKAFMPVKGEGWFCSCNIFDESRLPPTTWNLDWLLNHIKDILDYFTPQFFDAFIQVVVIQRPVILGIIVTVFLFLAICASFTRRKTERRCEAARKIVLRAGQST